jgi:hypothetical protein
MNSFVSAMVLGLLAIGCGSTGSDSGTGQVQPGLTVVVRGSTEAFTHDDGLPGQTARGVTAAVRSFTLIDEATSASFEVLKVEAANPVVVSYDNGSSTVLTVVDPQSVVPGHYTKARMVQDWSKFDVDVTLHEDVGATDGTLHVFQVTSNGGTLDGQAHDAGYYEHDFIAPNRNEHWSGDDAIVPEHSNTAGAEAVVENGEWAVYFQVDITVVAQDAELQIRVNMDHAFRWVDFPGTENEDGVYDIQPPLYEEVTQFGGNRFDVTYSAN